MAAMRVLAPNEETAQRALLYGSQMAAYVAQSQLGRCPAPLTKVHPSAKAYDAAMRALERRVRRAAESSVTV